MNQNDSVKKHQVQFGSEFINFSIQSSNRSTLAISVHPDKSVAVVAPMNSTIEKIEERVRKRAPWIIKQLTYFEQFLPGPTEKDFVAGESFRYLGRQYRLKIIHSSIENIFLDSSNIYANVNEVNNTLRIKILISNWYRERAQFIFRSRLKLCSRRFQNIQLPKHKLSIRTMKCRWGSCTNNGVIILNRDLIQAPSHCIDYVICHELTHLKVRNHTSSFFRILSKTI